MYGFDFAGSKNTWHEASLGGGMLQYRQTTVWNNFRGDLAFQAIKNRVEALG